MRRIFAIAAALALGAAAPAVGQQVYFGTLHGHTRISDGSGTPAQAYRYARDKAKLDFIALTEHNHDEAEGNAAPDRKDGILIAKQPALYNGPAGSSLINAARAATKDGKFVALYGQEFSSISHGNHVNVFDAPGVIDAPKQKFDQLLAWTAANPDSLGRAPLLQFNHPGGEDEDEEYGRDDFGGSQTAWLAAMAPHVALIEMLNGPAMTKGEALRSSEAHQGDYFKYLNLGFRLAPSAGQDNHYRTWGTSTDARAAVIANGLTKRDLLEAMRARHVYATEDKNLEVVFRSGNSLQGDIVPAPAQGSELPLSVFIRDRDEPNASYRIEVYIDTPGGAPATSPAEVFLMQGDTATPARLDGIRLANAGQFVLLKVIQRSVDEGPNDRVWTAPIWFETTAPALPLVPPALDTLRLVSVTPDPAGSDADNEEIVVRNISGETVTLAGWTVRDLAKNTWRLGDASLAAGQTLTIRRAGQAMSLNNDRDTVELIDPAGNPIQAFAYEGSAVGQAITIPP